MAEAIGLAASVITVSQTAWAVVKGLYDLADEVGSAGEAVRIFANDFALFVENLKELGVLLDSSPSVSRQTYILRGSIESTKAALPGHARKPTPRLLQSGQVVIEDQSMIKLTPAASATSLSIIGTAPNSRPVSDDQNPHTVGGGTVVATDVDDLDDADSASSSQAFAEIYLLADEVPEDRDDSREEQMELWGAIRTMQRKIVRLAEEAVVASGLSSGKTDNSSAHSATSVGTTPRETAVTLQPDEKTNSLGPQMEVSGARQDVILLLDTLGNDFETPYSAVRSWQAIKAFTMAEYVEVKADINDVLNLNEEAKRKAFHDAGYDNLLFGDTVGGDNISEGDIRRYPEGSNANLKGGGRFKVKTPQVLVAILDFWAQFLTAIDEEKFTIFYRPGPAGVKPGWIVELLFDNNELNDLKPKFPPSHRRIRCAHMEALRGVSIVGSLSAEGSPSSAEYKSRAKFEPKRRRGKGPEKSTSWPHAQVGGLSLL